MPVAKAFGGDFPVCTEKQKQELEEAHAKMVASKDDPYEGGACDCDLIIKLLRGEASQAVQMHAAVALAKDVYTTRAMMPSMQAQNRPVAIILLPGGMMPPAIPDDTPKGKPN